MRPEEQRERQKERQEELEGLMRAMREEPDALALTQAIAQRHVATAR
jgi:hypothetical protein